MSREAGPSAQALLRMAEVVQCMSKKQTKAVSMQQSTSTEALTESTRVSVYKLVALMDCVALSATVRSQQFGHSSGLKRGRGSKIKYNAANKKVLQREKEKNVDVDEGVFFWTKLSRHL